MRKAILPILLAATCTLSAFGQTPSTSTSPVISACVSALTGIPREVSSSRDCLKGFEAFQQWNTTGPQGVQGLPGLQGPQGSSGTPGAQGPVGPAGAIGAPGALGAKGDMGAAGQTGAPGAAGPQGAPGPKGDPGPTGVAGAAGATGAVGPIGPVGATGNSGPAGLQGPVGPSGPTGPAGPSGPAGATGGLGGQVWSANITFPDQLTLGGFYTFPIVGLGTATLGTDPRGIAVPVASSCTASNLHAALVGSTATSSFAVKIAVASLAELAGGGGENVPLICALAPNADGNPSTCSDTADQLLLAQGQYLYLYQRMRDSGLAGAHLLVSFTCN